MELALKTVDALLKMAVEKGKVTFDRLGLLALPDLINSALHPDSKPLGGRYLYDTIHLSIQGARKLGQATLSLEKASLNSLCEYLGYKNIDDFRNFFSPRMPRQAFALEGNWYSLVRCNSGLPYIIISPVRISAYEEETIMVLRGPHRHFEGNLSWLAGSISSVLKAEDGKILHLAFKVGLSKKPKLLQGVFSGVSTEGIPIAGRELLYRSEELDFDNMKNYKVKIGEASTHAALKIPEKVLQYFKDFDQTYLKVGDSSTFDLGDLP